MAEGTQANVEPELPWDQGSLLPDDVGVIPLQWVHPASPATKVARGAVTTESRRGNVVTPFPVTGPGKAGDRMIVVTQGCDLVKPAADLPQIEVARVFVTGNDRTISQAQDFGSARYFRLNDPQEPDALVLDYGQRALLDKGFLTAVAPDNSVLDTWSDERRKTLARWLGRRYSRPAIPDEDHEQITRPVREAWKQLRDNEPQTAARFNREYAEWRYRREVDTSLTIYILSPAPKPDELTALEVSSFLTAALESRFPGQVRVATDHRSYHTFTKADELSTEQISMEWASHEEDADDAALPE